MPWDARPHVKSFNLNRIAERINGRQLSPNVRVEVRCDVLHHHLNQVTQVAGGTTVPSGLRYLFLVSLRFLLAGTRSIDIALAWLDAFLLGLLRCSRHEE